jgi:ABC-type nitrate/sulfonate/bicarbonate transport system substrate-binding protein
MKTKLNIGGVPEHFNLPWHIAIKRGDFSNNNINLNWIDYPTGTGAMCADLRSGKLDLAVLLTEGAITDISKGNPSKILQLYVKTPILWGIHAPGNSGPKSLTDIKGKRYAISRKGSGSHLMAFVDAKLRGLSIEEKQLVIVNTLEGAREAFKKGEADLFLWEKLMTKPFVDSGEFKRIGERPTPWPAFVIVAREEVIYNHPGEIRKIQEIIIKSSVQFMNDKNSIEMVSQKFGFNKQDSQEWFGKTRWATDIIVEKDILESVVSHLVDLKLIDSKPSAEDLCHFCELV